MNRNHLWKLILIVLVLFWALAEMYPPTARDLVDYFRNRAVNRDATFKTIVDKAAALERERPDLSYTNLQVAISTNDITHYFPFFKIEKAADPTIFILNSLQREASGRVKLGLDLQGGVSFLVGLNTNSLADTNSSMTASAALSQAVEVLRKRVDALGVAEPLIQPQGGDRILIQLPGLSQAAMEEAAKRIKKVAFLEFRLVDPQSDEHVLGGQGVPGYEFKAYPHPLRDGRQVAGYLVRRRAELQGGIKSAGVVRNNMGQPEIHFTFNSDEAQTFARVTRDNVGHQLAIILDGELQSAPNIDEPIEGGSGVIRGHYKEEEAFGLANVLENPLKTPVHIISQQLVDPTLGKDSIRSGIKAALIGVIAVSAFMLVYYLLAGMVANVALMCNIIILLGVMCFIEATFTLPGIAGIVLTTGMAVDANVLIFERIREELAKGKSLRGALQAGYSRAFGTIFDSHVTTLISSIILIVMGTGSVKGFGTTLTWGVAASLFTALVITRLIFDWLISKNIIRSMPMLHVIRNTKIDFMRWAVPAFIASWLLICVGIGWGFYRGFHRNDLAGVEFSGGESITLAVNQQQKPPVDRIREIATRVSGREVLVSYQHDIGTGVDTLHVTSRIPEKAAQEDKEDVGTRIFQELKKEFPQAGFGGEKDKPLVTELVGAVIGEEIQQTAIIASLVALFGILIYVAVRYEFSFAVGAVVAIIHDVLMTLGWYFLTDRQLNATTVAAVLTIIGFSINDTIVIFDRIREDLKIGVRGSFRELINQALNQTLSRTIITSGTVFLATLSLFIFGGGPINDFAFTFLVGIITGTYSSIYIASALVLWLHKGQRPRIGGGQIAVEMTAPSPVQG